MNKKYEMTMQRKLRNTMAFGPNAQNEDMYTGETFGLLGSSAQASGLLRSAPKKEQKILKKRQNQASGLDLTPL